MDIKRFLFQTIWTPWQNTLPVPEIGIEKELTGTHA
jgi:hypothetical protein